MEPCLVGISHDCYQTRTSQTSFLAGAVSIL
jgi:hypothetical protein